MTRTVAVVTTSRADYGHLYWPIKDLSAHPDVVVRVIAIGPHLAPELGRTVRQLAVDDIAIDESVECLMSSDTDVGMAKTIGVAALGLADVLGRMRPDLLLLIADRYEMLAPASVALALRIPIAHIEGGELSEGAIDDAVRNALTMMSHVHLTTTESAKRRVIDMGEAPWRVHRVGAPSLDHLRRRELLDRETLARVLGMDLAIAPILVGYHPVTIARETTREAPALFEALERVDRPIVFTYPNADAGSRVLLEMSRAFCSARPACRLFENLEPLTYWSLLRESAALVGNSSSGIMEAASLCVPAVDVGIRQHGRERAANVLDANADADDIFAKLAHALDPDFRDSLAGLVNPYGDGAASGRIVEILTTIPLGEDLLRKRRPVDGEPRSIAI